mmetsp:Transcript_89112/g.154154  ORF Transcript_89112/g.154154 Transcript_89112/m.154154 type:complete len:431 (+) Transcript_89112:73-1365(+)
MASMRDAGSPLKASLTGHLRTLDGKLVEILARFIGDNVRERPELLDLRHRYCNEPFDPASKETEQMLQDIWNAAFPAEPITSAYTGEHWKKLGFQSSKPCSDIRAGKFALSQLHYLATERPKLLQMLAAEAQDLHYPFACSCFNVSHVIALFFDLYTSPAMSPVSGLQKASYTQMHNFVKVCQASADGSHKVLNELFCVLVEQLHNTWRVKQGTASTNVMDFPKALREVCNQHASFWRMGHTSTAELNVSWSSFPGSKDAAVGLGISQSDVLFFLGTNVLAAFNSILSACYGKTAMKDVQCANEDVRSGRYQPPQIPEPSLPELLCAESLPTESRTKRWLAKPANNIDVDSLLDSLCGCEALEAEASDLQAPEVDQGENPEGTAQPKDLDLTSSSRVDFAKKKSDLDVFLDMCLEDIDRLDDKSPAICMC